MRMKHATSNKLTTKHKQQIVIYHSIIFLVIRTLGYTGACYKRLFSHGAGALSALYGVLVMMMMRYENRLLTLASTLRLYKVAQ